MPLSYAEPCMHMSITGLWTVCLCLALVVPVLLICLSTDLQGIGAQTKEALKWTSVGILIFQCVSIARLCFVWRFGYQMEEESKEALEPVLSLTARTSLL